MLPEKVVFSHGVGNVVKDTCKLAFNGDVGKIFGITNAQLDEILNRVIDALPDSVFKDPNKTMLEEIKYICAREFIFFQVQERCDDPKYQDDLKAFIHVFAKDIEKRLNGQNKISSVMREEK